jgi:hypothetical protein
MDGAGKENGKWDGRRPKGKDEAAKEGALPKVFQSHCRSLLESGWFGLLFWMNLLRAGLDYGEEMHLSVKIFCPRQSYLM